MADSHEETIMASTAKKVRVYAGVHPTPEIGARVWIVRSTNGLTGSTSLILDDFRRLTVAGSRPLNQTDRSGDKGHTAEMQHFLNCVRGLEIPAITHIDGIRATLVCLAIWESARSGGVAVEIPKLTAASARKGL